MTPEAFGVRLDELRPSLEAYGQYVIDKVISSLRVNLSEQQVKQFLKVAPSFRVKDTESAMEKILKKGYGDPISQMTDVVGVRFVVLLEADIALVEKAIINSTGAWTPRKDRFPLFEIKENPEVFEYQSTHFVVRLNEDTNVGCHKIMADTPCEIQIRTLVQHAYAEFVHDRVYKPGKHVPPGVRRLVARAMAMLESTDLIFSEAADELACVNLSVNQWIALSVDIYKTHCGPCLTSVSESEARLFYETFRDILSKANSREVKELFQDHASKIGEYRDSENIFSHPFIVIVMWLLAKHDQFVAAQWPMGKYRTDLTTAASLLGIAL